MRRIVILMAVLGNVVALGFGGCAHYVNYPAIDGDGLAVHNPNVAPMAEVVALAVRRVVSRHPMEGEYVVNLPEGTNRRVAEWVVAEIGEGARIVTPGSEGLRVVHVKRVWVRGHRAVVEVARPVVGIGEEESHQTVTVRLAKPVFGVWEVVFVRGWAVGAAETPELYGWSEDWVDGGG